MNCIIVDDDQISRQTLEKLSEQISFLTIVRSFANPVEAINYLHHHTIDLMFLDIHMPHLTGIDLVKSIEKLPQVIFTTSDENYALEAFNYEVTDYVVKPVTLPRLLQAASKARLIYNSGAKQPAIVSGSVFVKVGSKLVKLVLDDILWIEATGDYVNIVTSQKAYTVLSTMKNIEQRLPDHLFVKVHRSYIVNVTKIKDLDDATLVINTKVIPVSRSNREKLLGKLNLL